MSEFILSNIVDKEKVFITNLSKIEGRLDPAFYKPEYFNILKKKVNWKKVKNILVNIHHPPEYERIYSETGIQLIRSQNVRPTGIYLSENPVFFSADFLKNKKTIFPQKGDILIVRSGVYAGDVAVIESDNKKAIIGADNLLLKPDLFKIIPKFIQIYFFTDSGRMLLNRYLTGATNKHMSPYFMVKVDFPLIKIEQQQRCIEIFESGILNKQKKETLAKQLLESIDDYLSSELGITMPEKDNSLQNRIYTTSLSTISGKRFDSDYYSLYYKELEHYVISTIYPSNSIASVVSHIASGKTPSSGDYSKEPTENPIIKAGSYTNEFIDLDKVDYTITSNNLSAQKEDIFILSAAHQAEYVGKQIKYLDECPQIDTSYVGELICIRVNKIMCNSMYLFSLLNTELFKTLINREKTGQAAHVYGKDIKHINIPLPPIEKQNEIAEHIWQIREQAKQLQQEAVEELEKAKREIEQMIFK